MNKQFARILSVKNQKNFFSDINDYVIGVDEVGRGALCGPVISCCVLLRREISENILINEINDSKKISAKKRLILSKFIKKNSIFSLGEASSREIDSINILNATIKSMKRALKKFDGYPNIIKIDGQKIFNYNERTFFLKKGDSISVSIASASIVAKVFRDDLMLKYSREYPNYKWEKNKGYGTKDHFSAIKQFGLTPLHRKSFLKNFIK